jgi:hypothetical protein
MTQRPTARIDYTRPARTTTNGCLHHTTIARIQLAADAMRHAGLTPHTANLAGLPACTCH